MATRKAAKLAIGKKDRSAAPNCPETGKPMTAVRVVRKNGSSGMHWVVVEDFKGTSEDEARMLRIG